MKASHFGVILAVGMGLTLPVLLFGIPFLSDDAAFHSAWYSHFSTQLWSGDFYPRWLFEMNGGLGSPVFYFYPPVPYFLTSILKPLFPNDAMGFHQLGVAASLALSASGLTAYLWLRKIVDEKSALAAAILYMAMPYHLAADLYVRSSYAEYWAFVWMPLILYFVQRLATGDQTAFIGAALAWALLIMTHLPTTIIFFAVPFLSAVLIAPENRRLSSIGSVLGSSILGIGLSAVFLAPALLTQQFVFLDQMTTGYFSWENWLFFAKMSLWPWDKITLALLTLDALAITACAFRISRTGLAHETGKFRLLWVSIALVCVFMMSELSKPVWWMIPLIQRIQFPWRFNAILTVAVTAMLALAFAALKQNQSSGLRAVKVFAYILIGVWIPITAWEAWSVYPQNGAAKDVLVRAQEVDESRDPPEYRPRWNSSMASIDWKESVNEEHWVELMNHDYDSLLSRARSTSNHPPEPVIVEGNGVARIEARKPREFDLHVESPTGVTMTVPQFYYPYWKAYILGEASELPVHPSQPDGLLLLSVPRGDYRIRLRMERGRPEIAGQWISLASLAIVLYLGLFRFNSSIRRVPRAT